MSTYFESKEDGFKSRKWLTIDATGVTLGRLASEIATLLRGKHKPTFTRHVDCGDFVIVTNVEKMKLTGSKATTKLYHHHTGYVGGVKTINAGDLLKKNPAFMLREAVVGMLPGGPLGHQLIDKLKMYRGAEHPHASQRPEQFTLKHFKAA